MNNARKFLARICLYAALILPVSSHAQENADDPAVTIEKYAAEFTVQPDGSNVLITEEQRLIGHERGIKTSAQQYFSFNASLQNIDILDAYTQKPDGRRIQVKPDQIKIQQEPRSTNAPMFQDIQYKVVIFPEVEVGDRLYVKFSRKQHTPLFPGNFQSMYVPSASRYNEFRVVYDLPSTMSLYEDNFGFQKTDPVTREGRTRYQWEFIPARYPRIETGSVSYLDYWKRLSVSTFPDYAAFARAYEAGAADKSAPTPKVKALAQKLTAGLNDPREKAKALYNWVRKNIRYVAVYIGQGGVVPHAADAVLDNLYGDCKDHVILLEALLNAVGIASTPALINLGNAFRLPTVPTLGVLNHVITYIPSLDLYLDSTARNIDFGYLPISDLGKPVVLAKTGTVTKTPSQQAGGYILNLRIKVNPDGSATFSHTKMQRGSFAEISRYAAGIMQPSARETSVRGYLQRVRLKGDGKIEDVPQGDSSDDFIFSTSGRIESLIDFPGPTGVPDITDAFYGIGTLLTTLDGEGKRTLPFRCLKLDAEESVIIELPESAAVTRIPSGAKLDTKYFYYQSTYGLNKNVVSISRTYRTKFGSVVCDQQDYEGMKDTIRDIRRDVNSQIIIGG